MLATYVHISYIAGAWVASVEVHVYYSFDNVVSMIMASSLDKCCFKLLSVAL